MGLTWLDKKGQLMVCYYIFHRIMVKKNIYRTKSITIPLFANAGGDWVTFHCAFWTCYRFWWLIISASNHTRSFFIAIVKLLFHFYPQSRVLAQLKNSSTRTCAKWPRIVDLKICSRLDQSPPLSLPSSPVEVNYFDTCLRIRFFCCLSIFSCFLLRNRLKAQEVSPGFWETLKCPMVSVLWC